MGTARGTGRKETPHMTGTVSHSIVFNSVSAGHIHGPDYSFESPRKCSLKTRENNPDNLKVLIQIVQFQSKPCYVSLH